MFNIKAFEERLGNEKGCAAEKTRFCSHPSMLLTLEFSPLVSLDLIQFQMDSVKSMI